MAKPQSFKKGDPRINRKGKPKGTKSFTTIVREALQVLSGVKDGKTELTMEQLLAKKMVADAIKKGDTNLRRLIWNYLDGMPAQKIGFDEETLEAFDEKRINAIAKRAIKRGDSDGGTSSKK